MNVQLPLPIVLGCDPRVQLAAARRLQKIVDDNRKSYETRRYRERRAAALKATRPEMVR